MVDWDEYLSVVGNGGGDNDYDRDEYMDDADG